MKHSILFISFLAINLFLFAQKFNVMTFNVRYDNKGDSINQWDNRKDYVSSEILFHHAKIVGLQEVLHNQIEDLCERLPQYKYVGVGRTDGKEKGEYAPIFYDTTRFNLITYNNFWLSQTPEVAGSFGWDAACERIVTWAKFIDKKTKKVFFIFNTHFDHMGQSARRESAKLLLARVNEIAGKNNAIITGDFNSLPSDEPIQIITDEKNPLRLIDTKNISQTPHYGPGGTFNGFKNSEEGDEPIDYIFLKGNQWKVLQHATISETWHGRFASDHFAVLAVIIEK